jgi:anti-anti-sigma factor
MFDDELMVARQGDISLMVVVGKGSFRMSTSLKQFGMQSIESRCRRIIVNLGACSTIDSTFMGILAKLATRIQQKTQGDLVLINLNSRTQEQLCLLGLQNLVTYYTVAETPEDLARLFRGCDQLSQAGTGKESDRERTETMIEAHETLLDVDPANIPKFRDVLAYLRDDLKRETRREADGEFRAG